MPAGWGPIVQDYVDNEIKAGGSASSTDAPSAGEPGGEGGMFDAVFGGGNAAPEASPQDATSGTGDGVSRGSDDGGGMCTMGHARASSGLLALGLLLVAALAAMRRRVLAPQRLR